MLQVNVGLYCNQACNHCHVESSPKRTETMSDATVARILELLAASPSVETVDITGGAPEMNAAFRPLVEGASALGVEVIDRCNLTVMMEPDMEWLGPFLAQHRVRVVASLPCYSQKNVDTQRGGKVFERSIAGLKALNALGYGQPGSGLKLDLVYNPGGAFLPPPQEALQTSYSDELRSNFGIVFNELFTMTNMPIKRFADLLHKQGRLAEYMQLLVDAFNPATVDQVMCRSLVSVAHDGSMYDCDFNQALAMPLQLQAGGARSAQTIWDIDSLDALTGAEVNTGNHCFGCTAGMGSLLTGNHRLSHLESPRARAAMPLAACTAPERAASEVCEQYAARASFSVWAGCCSARARALCTSSRLAPLGQASRYASQAPKERRHDVEARQMHARASLLGRHALPGSTEHPALQLVDIPGQCEPGESPLT